MIQSFSDEYETQECINDPVTPMELGRILVSGNECDLVSKARQTYYRSGVGKLLHVMRWSRPEFKIQYTNSQNIVRVQLMVT